MTPPYDADTAAALEVLGPPIGIFRAVERPVYGRGGAVRPEPASEVELEELLLGGDTWNVA